MSVPAGFAQASGEWLVEQLKKLQAEGELRRREISENNGRLIAENARADQITNTAQRAQVKAAIAKLVAKQAQIVKSWRTWWGGATKVATDGIAWLRSHGYATTGLSGPELLPLAIIAGLVAGGALWVTNSALKSASATAAAKIAEQKKLNDALLAGQLSDEQYAQLSAATANAMTAPGSTANPFKDLTSTLVTLGVIAVLVAVGPSLISAFKARPRLRVREA